MRHRLTFSSAYWPILLADFLIMLMFDFGRNRVGLMMWLITPAFDMQSKGANRLSIDPSKADETVS